MSSFVIGIAGGSGSGKTTLAERVRSAFPDDAVLISMDSYYRSHPELTYEERTRINYDHPDAFDIDLFAKHIASLKAGETVDVPVYDFKNHLGTDKTVTTPSRRIIILEGILLFADERLTDLMDMKVFVDTDTDVRLTRRIMRDVKERARSVDSVVKQYLATVKPMHEQFVEPSRRHANIIVPEGGQNHVALDMIINTLKIRIDT